MTGRTYQYPDPENPNQQGWWLETATGSLPPVAQAPPLPPPPTPEPAPAIIYGIDPQILGPNFRQLPPPPPALPQIAALPVASLTAAALPAAGAVNPRARNHKYSPQEIRAIAVLRLGVVPGALNWEATAAAVLAVCPELRRFYDDTPKELTRAAHNLSDQWNRKLKSNAEVARVQSRDASLREEMRPVLVAASLQQRQLNNIGQSFYTW